MEYMNFHPTINELGDDVCASRIIEGTITEFEDFTLQNYHMTYSKLMNCKVLAKLSLPMITSIGYGALINCESLTDVNIPCVDNIGVRAFENCKSLKKLSFKLPIKISSQSFNNAAIETLILHSTKSVSTLNSTTAFSGTPIEAGSGYIYVPRKMFDGTDGIAAYEAATNWSAFAGQFRYIRDYPEITGG